MTVYMQLITLNTESVRGAGQNITLGMEGGFKFSKLTSISRFPVVALCYFYGQLIALVGEFSYFSLYTCFTHFSSTIHLATRTSLQKRVEGQSDVIKVDRRVEQALRGKIETLTNQRDNALEELNDSRDSVAELESSCLDKNNMIAALKALVSAEAEELIEAKELLVECAPVLVESLDCIAGCRMREEDEMGGVNPAHDEFQGKVEDLARRVKAFQERENETL